MPATRVQVSAAIWYSYSCYWALYCESRCRGDACIKSAAMLGYPFTPTTWRISLSHSSKTNTFSDQPFVVNMHVSNVAFRPSRTSSQSTISHKHQRRIYSRICVVEKHHDRSFKEWSTATASKALRTSLLRRGIRWRGLRLICVWLKVMAAAQPDNQVRPEKCKNFGRHEAHPYVI